MSIERQLFERKFPVPPYVEWSGDKYRVKPNLIGGFSGLAAYQGKWDAWQASVDAGHTGSSAAVSTLLGMGFTYHGGQLWKPPLGKKPDFDAIDTLRTQLEEMTADRDAEKHMKGVAREQRDKMTARASDLEQALEQASFKISTLEADAAQYRSERDQLQLDLNEKDRLIDLLRPRDTVRSTTANGDQVTIHASGKIELDQIKPMVEADRDIKMPDRKILGCFSDGAAVIAVAVWNACLDEVCRLNNSSMKAPLDSGVRHVGFKSPPTQHTATFDKEKVTVVIENDLITSKSERIY